VRAKPLLVTILAITAFYGAAGEGFGRLYVAHFIDNIGFPSVPDFEPVVWFGALRLASSLLTLVALRQVRLNVDTTSHRSVSRALLVINSVQMGSLVVFALTGDFYIGALSYLGAAVLSRMFDPLYLAWINQNVESHVRATVISINNQFDSFGQIGGGPVLGAAGSLGSTRLAMLGAALLMSPAIALYFRAFGQSPGEPEEALQAEKA
jgi:DHA3 family tetracycline resistance protein-like MFS transporter